MHPLVGLVFDTLEDMERATAGLAEDDALGRAAGQNAIAWTVTHYALSVDHMINVSVRGMEPHPILARLHGQFGRSGDCADWLAVQAAARDVRAASEAYLAPLEDAELDGIRSRIRPEYPEVSLRYLLSRIVAHGYLHVGEIATLRGALGHRVGDFPGALGHTLAAEAPRPASA
jgi:Protein of unknown function (DUF664)